MANSTIDIFRKNLKYFRKQLGLSQDKLSELSGIGADYLSEIERGRKNADISLTVGIDFYDLLNIIC